VSTAEPNTLWQNRIVGYGTKPASQFNPHPNNWRKHPARQKTAVQGSLQSIGWFDVVIDNIRTGHVIDGHERIEEAAKNGDADVPYIQVDLSPEEEAQALLSIDAMAALATTDRMNMEALLDQVNTSNTDVLKFLSDLARDSGIDYGTTGDDDAGQQLIDKAAELRMKWGTEPGQMWQIGKHRIICADSTKPKTFKQLMGGEVASMVFIDPPYGVDYESRGSGESVLNDELKQDELVNQLLKPAFKQLMDHTLSTAGFYIFHASSTRRDFEWAMDAVGLEEKQYLVWVKETFVMGHSDYRWQHEPFFYAQKQGSTAAFYGDRKQSTCWRIRVTPDDHSAVSIAAGVLLAYGEHKMYLKRNAPKSGKVRLIRMKEGESMLISDNSNSSAWEIRRDSAKEYLHPTQKPPGLARRAIENSSTIGEIVIDSFLGAGATLIAAEKTSRRCRGVELDPKYIAVTLERAAQGFPGIDISQLQ